MVQPYSDDLREAAIARVEAGESCRAVARDLRVAASSVIKWVQLYRATGSVTPRKMGGHVPPKIRGSHEEWLRARITNDSDFTLRGLVAELDERGLKVDYRTVWKFVHAQGLSHKKNRNSG